MSVHAISVPTPDDPPALSPVEQERDPRRPPPRWARMAAATGLAIVAFALGWAGRGAATPPTAVEPPGLASTLGWMFDAALAHEATTITGEAQPAAARSVVVQQARAIDPLTGPLLVVATVDGAPAAYEVAVQRRGLDWSVQARRLASDDGDALSR